MDVFSQVIFVSCSLFFLISINSSNLIKNISNASPRFYLFVSANYALMGTNLICMIFFVIHKNQSLWFLFHFDSRMERSHNIFFSFGFLKIDYFSFFMLILYSMVLLISLIRSQSILSLIPKGLKDPINGKYIKRIEKFISTNSWLKKCRIYVIIDEKPDAMAYSLFRISHLKLKLVNEIIITTALMDLVNDDELEAVLAHEYSQCL